MKRKAKIFCTIAMTLAVLVSTVGCTQGNSNASGEANPSSKTPENTESKSVLELWSRGNSTDTHAESVIYGAELFTERTGKKVNVQFIPHNDAVTKWNAAFASGTAPDVMDVGIVHIAERVKLGHIVSMNEYFDSWSGKDDIYPAMKELGTFDKEWVAVAHFPDPQIFAYRKDMFEAAGLDSSRPPKDWDELLEYAKKLTIRDEKGNVTRAGMAIPTQGARFIANPLVRQNGGSFADEVNNKPTMTTPEAIEALTFLGELQKCSLSFNNDNQDNNPLVMDSAAMGYMANGNLSNYIRNNPDMADKFGFAACVPQKQSASWSGVWFYTITSQAKNKDDAFALIDALTSTETLTKRVTEKGLPSTFASSMEKYVDINPTINQAVADAVACGAGNPKVVWAPLYEKAIDQACEEVFFGVKTPEQALKDAEEALLKEIS